ncbi:hypothetical protein [Hoylesella buccalis]|uniref:hypothetical protein n=1 Tax=Hoylesella buccalis TaxID=28127 RepID=UPI002889C145|nr:hypothetical protein [Hoylesella buccalis]
MAICHRVESRNILAQAIKTTNISNVHGTDMHTTSFSEMTEQVEDDYLVNTSENIINNV